MTNHEFQLRQYVIRLKSLVLHYVPENELKAYHGLLNAIDATFEEMDNENKHMMKSARSVHKHD